MTSVSPALLALRKELFGDLQPEKRPKYSYDFSFSGLKTAVLRLAQEQIGEDFTFPSLGLAARLSDSQKADIAASFQRVALETVVDKTLAAFNEFAPATVIIGGGVASSTALRALLAERLPIPVTYADRKLCTDNGAMIATLGCYKRYFDQPTADPYTLDIKPNLSM
jgi:N6-L-threonylcarbamoyladenine synthase